MLIGSISSTISTNQSYIILQVPGQCSSGLAWRTQRNAVQVFFDSNNFLIPKNCSVTLSLTNPILYCNTHPSQNTVLQYSFPHQYNNNTNCITIHYNTNSIDPNPSWGHRKHPQASYANGKNRIVKYFTGSFLVL